MSAKFKRDQFYETGRRAGRQTTLGSGATRFDSRSQGSRSLNESLDAADGVIGSIEFIIKNAVEETSSAINEYQTSFARWVRRRAAARACIAALVTGSVVAYVAQSQTDDVSDFAGLFWCPAPIHHEAAIWFFLSATPTFLLFYAFRGRRLIRRSNIQLGSLSAKWSTNSIEDYIEPLDAPTETLREDFSQSEASHEDSASPIAESADWDAVLGVSSDASPDTIRDAYRKAMKDYHPDRVAGLGEKLRVVAEEETKRYNAAYQEARAARGF